MDATVADCDAQDKYGGTPLIEAVMYANLSHVHRLLRGKANPNVLDYAGQSALLVAVRGRRQNIAQELVEAGAGECGCHKLLPYALQTQTLSLVNLVLRAGCDYTVPEAPSENTRPLVEAAVRERWLAVLMSLHPRLGAQARCCSIRVLPHELLQHVCLQWLSPPWLRSAAQAHAHAAE